MFLSLSPHCSFITKWKEIRAITEVIHLIMISNSSVIALHRKTTPSIFKMECMFIYGKTKPSVQSRNVTCTHTQLLFLHQFWLLKTMVLLYQMGKSNDLILKKKAPNLVVWLLFVYLGVLCVCILFGVLFFVSLVW